MTIKVRRVAETIRSFSAKERNELAQTLLDTAPAAVEELVEDIHDLRVLQTRKNESARPYAEFLKDVKRRKV